MKKILYGLLVLGLAIGFNACDKPDVDEPQTEQPAQGGNDEENGGNTGGEETPGAPNTPNPTDPTEPEEPDEPENPTDPTEPENPSAPETGKTLIVYYSFTNNVHAIVSDLRTQIEADVIRIEPSEKGLDYAANNYAIGSAQIAKIRNAPNDPASYPGIDAVNVHLADYSTIFVAAPLWWSQMAAPLQTFLFQNGAAMAGKKIGLIVSSASSGISGVESDAKRLIPQGDFMTPSLWIRSSQTSNSHSLLENWLTTIGYPTK